MPVRTAEGPGWEAPGGTGAEVSIKAMEAVVVAVTFFVFGSSQAMPSVPERPDLHPEPSHQACNEARAAMLDKDTHINRVTCYVSVRKQALYH